MSLSNNKQVHSTRRNTTVPTKTPATKQQEEDKPTPPQTVQNALDLLELARINLYITIARSQKGNAGTENLIKAAEQPAKADGNLDAFALEKMRDKLKKGCLHRHPSSFWTREVDKLEAVVTRRVRNVEQLRKDQSRVLNGMV